VASFKLNSKLEPTMTAIKLKKNQTCALGVTVVDGVIELYGVNQLNEVVLHGWFDHEPGLAIIRDRPSCLIALEEKALPKEFIALLEALGHSVVIIPSTPESIKSIYRRQAKDCCDIARGWMNPQQAPNAAYSGTRLQLA